MSDRRPVPLLILSILVVLTAGAIVTGLVLAPAADDLTVQNAAGENLLASHLTVRVVATETESLGSQVQRSPTETKTFTFNPTVTPDTSTQAGADANVILAILHRVTQSSPWVTGPVAYRYTGSVAALLGIPATATSNGLVVSLHASGTAHSWVSSGYLAAFFVRFTIKASSVTERATELVEFKQIGSYTPNLSHVST